MNQLPTSITKQTSSLKKNTTLSLIFLLFGLLTPIIGIGLYFKLSELIGIVLMIIGVALFTLGIIVSIKSRKAIKINQENNSLIVKKSISEFIIYGASIIGIIILGIIIWILVTGNFQKYANEVKSALFSLAFLGAFAIYWYIKSRSKKLVNKKITIAKK